MERNIIHCNITETIIKIQEFIQNGTDEVLVIDTDLKRTKDILDKFFVKPKYYPEVEGLYQEQGYYKGGSIIADNILFSRPFPECFLRAADYTDLLDYARRENKRVVILLAQAQLEKIQADVDIVICHNEFALTAGEMIIKLQTIENPDDVYPVFLQKGAFFASNASNGGLIRSGAFNSIELQSSSSGPAISVSSFLNSLFRIPSDTVLEVMDCGYPLKKWILDFEITDNIVSFNCWNVKQTLEAGLKKLRDELSTSLNE